MHFQRYTSYGKFAHVNRNVDSNTHFDAFEYANVQGKFKNTDTSINVLLQEQYYKDYIIPSADLESRPPSRGREQPKYMYPE